MNVQRTLFSSSVYLSIDFLWTLLSRPLYFTFCIQWISEEFEHSICLREWELHILSSRLPLSKSTSVFVCLPIWLSLSLSLSLSVCLSVSLSLSLSVSLSLSLSVSLCLSLSISLSLPLPLYITSWLVIPLDLNALRFVTLHLSTCLSVNMSPSLSPSLSLSSTLFHFFTSYTSWPWLPQFHVLLSPSLYFSVDQSVSLSLSTSLFYFLTSYMPFGLKFVDSTPLNRPVQQDHRVKSPERWLPVKAWRVIAWATWSIRTNTE